VMDSIRMLLCEEASDELEALFAIYEGDLSYVEVVNNGDKSTVKPTGKSTVTSTSSTSNAATSDAVKLLMQFHPRTADTQGLVSASLAISLPTGGGGGGGGGGYPTQSPCAVVARTSGLGDDGRALGNIVSEYIACAKESGEPGEPCLMDLFEVVFDYLDSANEGECLICNEPLLQGQGQGQGQGQNQTHKAIRTNCYHCFHVACLCRWGAVCHVASMASQAGSLEQTQASSGLKAIEGDLRAREQAKAGAVAEIARLECEIASLTAELASSAIGVVVPLPLVADAELVAGHKKARQKGGKAPAAQAPAPADAPASKSQKKGKGASPLPPPAPIPAPAPAPLPAPTAAEAAEEAAESRRTGIALQQCRSALGAAMASLARHSIGVTTGQEALLTARAVARGALEGRSSYCHADGVRCPFCTTTISEATHPHAAAALRAGFDEAVERQLALVGEEGGTGGIAAAAGSELGICTSGTTGSGTTSGTTSSGKNSGSSSSSHNSSKGSNTNTTRELAGGVGTIDSSNSNNSNNSSGSSSSSSSSSSIASVLSLPPSLVEMVRSIQQSQAALRARLKSMS
jgi:hypothetical protein